MTTLDPARRGPRRHLAALALAAALLAALVPGQASGATRFTLDVSDRGDFVAQTNFVQCVGASMQMMLNMIEPGRDRTAATQLRLQKLARTWSGSRPDGRQRQGASVRGWAAGLNILGAGPYRLVGDDTLDEAMDTAAEAIAATGPPGRAARLARPPRLGHERVRRHGRPARDRTTSGSRGRSSTIRSTRTGTRSGAAAPPRARRSPSRRWAASSCRAERATGSAACRACSAASTSWSCPTRPT